MILRHRPGVPVLWVVVASGVLTLAGCGGEPTAAVSGIVTVGGKPLSEGSIHFELADGASQSAGATITDGKYELLESANLRPGKVHVTIRGAIKTGKQVEAGPPSPKGTMIDEVNIYPPIGIQPVPQDAELVAGENQKSFDLPAIPARKR